MIHLSSLTPRIRDASKGNISLNSPFSSKTKLLSPSVDQVSFQSSSLGKQLLLRDEIRWDRDGSFPQEWIQKLQSDGKTSEDIKQASQEVYVVIPKALQRLRKNPEKLWGPTRILNKAFKKAGLLNWNETCKLTSLNPKDKKDAMFGLAYKFSLTDVAGNSKEYVLKAFRCIDDEGYKKDFPWGYDLHGNKIEANRGAFFSQHYSNVDAVPYHFSDFTEGYMVSDFVDINYPAPTKHINYEKIGVKAHDNTPKNQGGQWPGTFFDFGGLELKKPALSQNKTSQFVFGKLYDCFQQYGTVRASVFPKPLFSELVTAGVLELASKGVPERVPFKAEEIRDSAMIQSLKEKSILKQEGDNSDIVYFSPIIESKADLETFIQDSEHDLNQLTNLWHLSALGHDLKYVHLKTANLFDKLKNENIILSSNNDPTFFRINPAIKTEGELLTALDKFLITDKKAFEPVIKKWEEKQGAYKFSDSIRDQQDLEGIIKQNISNDSADIVNTRNAWLLAHKNSPEILWNQLITRDTRIFKNRQPAQDDILVGLANALPYFPDKSGNSKRIMDLSARVHSEDAKREVLHAITTFNAPVKALKNISSSSDPVLKQLISKMPDNEIIGSMKKEYNDRSLVKKVPLDLYVKRVLSNNLLCFNPADQQEAFHYLIKDIDDPIIASSLSSQLSEALPPSKLLSNLTTFWNACKDPKINAEATKQFAHLSSEALPQAFEMLLKHKAMQFDMTLIDTGQYISKLPVEKQLDTWLTLFDKLDESAKQCLLFYHFDALSKPEDKLAILEHCIQNYDKDYIQEKSLEYFAEIIKTGQKKTFDQIYKQFPDLNPAAFLVGSLSLDNDQDQRSVLKSLKESLPNRALKGEVTALLNSSKPLKLPRFNDLKPLIYKEDFLQKAFAMIVDKNWSF